MSYWIVGITTVLNLVGTGVAVAGQQQAASDAENAAAFNAAQDRIQSQQEQEAAAENARRKQGEIDKQLAAQRAAFASRGLSLEGTPLAVLGDDALSGARDILDIGYAADARSRALQAGASITELEGKNTASSLRTESVATGIKGVASAGYSYGTGTGLIAPKSKSYFG